MPLFSGRRSALNQPENSHPLAISILDTVEYVQDHFRYGYHFVVILEPVAMVLQYALT